ncbi:hypothetical protein ACIBQ5_14855 [Streptomyces massasporeus]|uniref:hypothetical protein n=1 Tax=Streptomyces massasporeus TaxID=67324 RepID=UPI0037AF4DAC
MRPEVVGRIGLYAVLLANAVVVAVFFAQAGFASNALIVLGRLTGLYAALLMAFQLLLVARLPWFEASPGWRLTARTTPSPDPHREKRACSTTWSGQCGDPGGRRQ